MSAGSRGLEASPAPRWSVPAVDRAVLIRMGGFVLFAAVASVIYGQASLYTSNQNQYFLHGLARAGVGFLREDWLAQTADPTPVFSMLVAFTSRYLHASLFYGYYALLAGVYFASLIGITSQVVGRSLSRGSFALYVALVAAMHSAVLRDLSLALRGIDLRAVLTYGLAGQYLMESMLQPSLFGVFLLVSIHAAMRGRLYAGVGYAAVAATVHPAYLLDAGVLVLAYLLMAAREQGKLRASWRLAAAAGALLLPIAAYAAVTFRPTSGDMLVAAQQILATVRLPHHALVRVWWGPLAALQVVFIGAGLLAVRRSARLVLVWEVSCAVALALTALQLATGSAGLALLFPWRVSVFLVPVATSVLAAHGAVWITARLSRPQRVGYGAAVVIVVLTAVGAAKIQRGVAESRAEASVPVMEFVRTTKAAGDRYLIPANLERFRLYTGSPVFVDRKAIPYRDVEVGQWYERYRAATGLYALRDPGRTCAAITQLARHYRLTHAVLWPGEVDGSCRTLIPVYQDPAFAVYRIGAAAP